MDFKDYQAKSRRTALYTGKGYDLTYPTLGLAGEAGEVADHIKKVLRDDGGTVTPERKEKIKKELGDVLWYLSQVATDLGIELDDVAEANIKKLYSRMDRGKLHGEGDDR